MELVVFIFKRLIFRVIKLTEPLTYLIFWVDNKLLRELNILKIIGKINKISYPNVYLKMRSFILLISFAFLSSVASAQATLSTSQLIYMITDLPAKEISAYIKKAGFEFDKKTPVPSYEQKGSGNIKDAYRLYFKNGAQSIMFEVLKNDKCNIIYNLQTDAQLKALVGQAKQKKLKQVPNGQPNFWMYQINTNCAMAFTGGPKPNVELRNVVYYMDIHIL